MAINTDSTQFCACNSDMSVAHTPSPEFSSPPEISDLLRTFAAAGISVDHVFRVVRALDEHAGSRELGDLVGAISDAIQPLRVIEEMIESGLIRFVPGHAFDAAAPIERIV